MNLGRSYSEENCKLVGPFIFGNATPINHEDLLNDDVPERLRRELKNYGLAFEVKYHAGRARLVRYQDWSVEEVVEMAFDSGHDPTGRHTLFALTAEWLKIRKKYKKPEKSPDRQLEEMQSLDVGSIVEIPAYPRGNYILTSLTQEDGRTCSVCTKFGISRWDWFSCEFCSAVGFHPTKQVFVPAKERKK